MSQLKIVTKQEIHYNNENVPHVSIQVSGLLRNSSNRWVKSVTALYLLLFAVRHTFVAMIESSFRNKTGTFTPKTRNDLKKISTALTDEFPQGTTVLSITK